MKKGRLVVVSNRLPVTLCGSPEEPEFKSSPGGLATGLRTYFDHKIQESPDWEGVWLGWTGQEVATDSQPAVEELLCQNHNCIPIHLSREESESFYHGFCNTTLWPLFHYFYVYANFDAAQWAAYVRVNEIFAAQIAKVITEDDTVWIHDYQLMPLPALLRRQFPRLRIGFFLHIPFPAYEIFRILPQGWQRVLMEGVFGADLIGFHTHDYAQNFLRCSLRILGLEHRLGLVQLPARSVKVDTFPMGIDFEHYSKLSGSEGVERERRRLRVSLGDRRIVVSVDRLDYTKGILQRLEAYEQFLAACPELRSEVVLVLVVVPSREGVAEYDRMKASIDQKVGAINGSYGSLAWTPIVYHYRSLDPEQLSAIYSVSDVALVTPLRDGMNLVAKEFLASHNDELGVLVLSTMAGAAAELGEAIIVNPNDRMEVALGIRDALTMPEEAKRKRCRALRRRLGTYNVVRWADDFLEGLSEAIDETCNFERNRIAGGRLDELVAAFATARTRLILTDYDGTLVGFSEDPLQAVPSTRLLEILGRLSSLPETHVALVSGRLRQTLETWLGDLPVGLVAEHGAYIKQVGSDWRLAVDVQAEWKNKLRPVFQHWADRLAGSFVEEKDFSLVWHYRASHPDLGNQRALELVDELTQFTANIEVQILTGNKVVEARSQHINKGLSVREFNGIYQPDFIMAIGDDWTDEDLFRASPPNAWTVKVGTGGSAARFRVKDYTETLQILETLGKIPNPEPLISETISGTADVFPN
ncbi:MAG: bifunctional alpha,alpha-trehalose-phosphate synthase (UDP-forming)/trehalose-phosphatase [Candidatus Sumerlaeaceae bacterium]|nr:bifunctional alpha,alpha-trehalose-phosphate synthase (UDP-forming)/trehalose-phosphatase [Candidatus Sumerlaeaceae bacterium]